MKEQFLFESIPVDKHDLLTREDLVILVTAYEDVIKQFQEKLKQQEKELFKSEQASFLINEQVIIIKNRLFGKSSEKSGKKKISDRKEKEPRKRILLPSERYPNAEIVEKRVELKSPPSCPCCSGEMKDSGLTEDSEYLTVIPRRFYVVQQKRVKYRCSSCHGGLVTTPAIPRITEGSSYSDEFIIDVSLSKYCDLIPIERYCQMAARSEIPGLPANTLIQGTHNLAAFLMPVYEKIKEEVMNSKVIHADETPHRMLEGDAKTNWFLWGFSSDKASYFENHDTRSGSVAAEFLKNSHCEYLMSDVFTGYAKAVNQSNQERLRNNLPEIKKLYCNAHARRKFKEASINFEHECKFFLWCYGKIYSLEKREYYKNRRVWGEFYYKAMENFGLKLKTSLPRKSSLFRAIDYFLRNLHELKYFLRSDDLPIDNNPQERLLRNPVIGRKTWYGTHSKQGAKTNAVLFSLVESCKLNKVNPRDYFKDLVHAIHEKKDFFTPNEYLKMNLSTIS